MHIAIDARLYGLKHAGIGRYVKNLIDQLARLDTINHYTLIVAPGTKIEVKPQNCQVIISTAKHYSLAEQTHLLTQLNAIPADLFHFPHFNVPLLFNRPYIVTIHDLLWHEKKGSQVTTLNPLIYRVKYLGYRLVIWAAAVKALRVITPTHYVANAVTQAFSLPASKVKVTYEAADEIFHRKHPQKKSLLKKYQLPEPFIFYLGSLYPHKNVLSVVRALKQVPEYQLVISSARNVFSERFLKQVAALGMKDRVRLINFASDEEVIQLFMQAQALVLPSESEGFGLTGLEAMAMGTPVICSDQPVLREIYKDGAIFVDTKSPKAIAESLKRLKQKGDFVEKKNKAQGIAREYSWRKMAQETLAIYQHAV